MGIKILAEDAGKTITAIVGRFDFNAHSIERAILRQGPPDKPRVDLALELALDVRKLETRIEVLEKTNEWYQELLEYILSSTSDYEVKQLLEMIKRTNGEII